MKKSSVLYVPKDRFLPGSKGRQGGTHHSSFSGAKIDVKKIPMHTVSCCRICFLYIRFRFHIAFPFISPDAFFRRCTNEMIKMGNLEGSRQRANATPPWPTSSAGSGHNSSRAPLAAVRALWHPAPKITPPGMVQFCTVLV